MSSYIPTVNDVTIQQNQAWIESAPDIGGSFDRFSQILVQTFLSIYKIAWTSSLTQEFN